MDRQRHCAAQTCGPASALPHGWRQPGKWHIRRLPVVGRYRPTLVSSALGGLCHHVRGTRTAPASSRTWSPRSASVPPSL